MAEAPPKDPITCHVLDTTTGRPAPHIKVKLHNPTLDATFEGSTNGDGRIANWGVRNGDLKLQDTVQYHGSVRNTLEFFIRNVARKEGDANEGPEIAHCPAGSSIWSLEFDTGGYFGYTNTFFPKVDLTFLVKEGQHYHVPLLLGPYSFTTYRGS